jgi:hypothetical protein
MEAGRRVGWWSRPHGTGADPCLPGPRAGGKPVKGENGGGIPATWCPAVRSSFLQCAVRQHLSGHASRPGWEAVVGYDGDKAVGYAYDSPLPPNARWWAGMFTPLSDDLTRETGKRTLALFELMVRVPWRKTGTAHRIHEELLTNRPEERVTLLVEASHPKVANLYEQWGYKNVGDQRPFLDAPVYATMIRHLHSRPAPAEPGNLRPDTHPHTHDAVLLHLAPTKQRAAWACVANPRVPHCRSAHDARADGAPCSARFIGRAGRRTQMLMDVITGSLGELLGGLALAGALGTGAWVWRRRACRPAAPTVPAGSVRWYTLEGRRATDGQPVTIPSSRAAGAVFGWSAPDGTVEEYLLTDAVLADGTYLAERHGRYR